MQQLTRGGREPPCQARGRFEGPLARSYCTNRCYLYCPICFPGAENGDLTVIDYGICNPATGRNCYAKHITGVKNTHHMHKNLPQRTSPHVERRRARTEEGEGEEPEPRSGRMPHRRLQG